MSQPEATHRRLAAQDGFTIYETTIAALVLLIGMIATLSILDAGNAVTTTVRAREQAVGLERELIDASRSIPYNELTPSSIVPTLQAMPNLGNAGGPGWTITRRGVNYQVSIGVCHVGSPTASADPQITCAAGATTAPTTPCSNLLGLRGSVQGDASAISQISGTLNGQLSLGLCGIDANLDGRIDNLAQADVALCLGGAACPQSATFPGDANPDDYARITVLLTWTANNTGHYLLQSTNVPNPGLAGAGPTVTGLTSNPSVLPIVPGSVLGLVGGSPAIQFTAATSADTTKVSWYVDGTYQGDATGSPGSYAFAWVVGVSGSGLEVMDGSYTVSATPFNSSGVQGHTASMTVTLNRRQPYAPTGLVGGRNLGTSLTPAGAAFSWVHNRERDISSYRMYKVATPSDVQVCDTGSPAVTSCEFAVPGTPQVPSPSYYVAAVDRDPSGNLRVGDHSSPITLSNTPVAPSPPTNLQATAAGGQTTLTWSAPALSVDPVATYKIYRDSGCPAQPHPPSATRYDSTPGTTQYVDASPGGTTHTYYVTAVDANLSESTCLGPVTK